MQPSKANFPFQGKLGHQAIVVKFFIKEIKEWPIKTLQFLNLHIIVQDDL